MAKEQDLTLVTDCSWVRGLDANGNSIRIAKADLVELIRKEMPVATADKNGLMSKDGFLSRGMSKAFNDTHATGLYMHSNTASDYPGSTPYGMLLVFNAPGMTVQIYMSTDSILNIRLYASKQWSPWKRISFT